MATQSILGSYPLPWPPPQGITSVALTQVAQIAADTALAAFVVQAPKTGNIRKVRWGTRTVNTGGTMDVRIETIDATTGHPSGTLWGTTTNGAQVVADANDNVWFTTTLTADAAVTKGDLIAVCVKTPAATSLNVLTAWNISAANSIYPYFRFFNGTSWAGTGSGSPMVMLEYDDGSYAPIRGCYPAGNVTTHAVSTSTTPDAVGVRFQLPFPVNVSGIWAGIDIDGDCAVRLVSTAYHQANATGILGTATLDKDNRSGTAVGLMQADFDGGTVVSLAANTFYRLIVEGTTTTSVNGPSDIEVPSLAGLDSWPVGQNWHLTTAKDPTADGSWTNFNSGTFRTVPTLGLMINGNDYAVSVGGGGISRGRVQLGM